MTTPEDTTQDVPTCEHCQSPITMEQGRKTGYLCDSCAFTGAVRCGCSDPDCAAMCCPSCNTSLEVTSLRKNPCRVCGKRFCESEHRRLNNFGICMNCYFKPGTAQIVENQRAK